MNNNFDIGQFVNVKTQQSILFDLVQRVKARRKEMKCSREKLSSISGVSYASIRRFEETGEISLSSLLKIAQALNSLNDFEYLFKNRIITSLKDLK